MTNQAKFVEVGDKVVIPDPRRDSKQLEMFVQAVYLGPGGRTFDLSRKEDGRGYRARVGEDIVRKVEAA